MGTKVEPITVSVKISGELLSDASSPYSQRFFHSDTLPELKASGYASEAKIKAAIKADAQALLKEASDARANYRKKVIGTNEGTILLILWEHGEYFIRTAGPGRPYCNGGSKGDPRGFDATVEYARKWAVGCFNGIAWES